MAIIAEEEAKEIEAARIEELKPAYVKASTGVDWFRPDPNEVPR